MVEEPVLVRTRRKSAALFACALSVATGTFVTSSIEAIADDAPLKVEAISPGDRTGTMHFSEELRLTVGDSAGLTLRTSVATGKLIPIPGPQYRVDASHVLLLGWSSYGGGMQTVHAMLVEVENGSVKLHRELALTAERGFASLIVRRNGANEILLGIGEPSSRMFDEHDWLLVLGPAAEERLDIARIRKLPFVGDEKRADDVFYALPSGNTPFPRRIAWFSVSASGFASLTGAR